MKKFFLRSYGIHVQDFLFSWCWESSCVQTWCLSFLLQNSQHTAAKRIFVIYIKRDFNLYFQVESLHKEDRHDLEVHVHPDAGQDHVTFITYLHSKKSLGQSLCLFIENFTYREVPVANTVFRAYPGVKAHTCESRLRYLSNPPALLRKLNAFPVLQQLLL